MPRALPGCTVTGDEDRRARAVLTAVCEPGDLTLQRLLADYQPAELVAALRTGQDLGARATEAWRARLTHCDPDAALARCTGLGGRLVCPGDDDWPPTLDDLEGVLSLERGTRVQSPGSGPGRGPGAGGRSGAEVRAGGPPVALWVRGGGSLAALCTRSVAVVGSRAATSYGTQVAGDLGYGAARSGVTVVSGAAYGIDVAAHRGALVAEAPTVAVLACGVDLAYPRGHEQLLDRIAGDGLVVSEVPPGTGPTRVRFLTRNRLIAALTLGTVVVEAALRSGALNTARWAGQLLRPLMGVPGAVTSDVSAGVHELIRSGQAELVTCADEVLAGLLPVGELTLPFRHGETRLRDRLDDTTLAVLEAVPVLDPARPEQIARSGGVSAQRAREALAGLLADGMVEQTPGGYRIAVRMRRER